MLRSRSETKSTAWLRRTAEADMTFSWELDELVARSTRSYDEKVVDTSNEAVGSAHDDALAHARGARRVGAPGGDRRAAARGAGRPAAPGCGADALRVLRARGAVRRPRADLADDRPGPADQRNPAPPLARRTPPGGARAGRAVPVPRGRSSDECATHDRGPVAAGGRRARSCPERAGQRGRRTDWRRVRPARAHR